MSFAENKWLWVSGAVLIFLAVVLVWVFLSSERLTLIILFDDVGGLKKEDRVVWKDFTIGKVADIRPLVDNQIGVTIVIGEDYVSKITHGTQFYLKRAPLSGILGSDSIEVVTPSSPGAPFANGEKVQGKYRPSVVEEGKKWTLETWQQLKEQTRQLIDDFQQSGYQEDAEEALRQLKEITEEGARQARDKAEEFRKKHEKDLDRVLKKLETLRDEMRAKGDDENAQRIDKRIEKMKR